MLEFRDRNTRGAAELGWLSSRHSFSFGSYHDPRHMGFRALRVINEDRVAPGAGFPPHSHANMEILSYVLSGELRHEDSLGTGSVIRPGEIQRMSAGSGITHSEMNPSASMPVHFLQIWILPSVTGIAPSYEQKPLPAASEGETRLDLIGSPEGGTSAVTIHQDVKLYRGILAPGDTLDYPVTAERFAWIQVLHGVMDVDGGELREGDGLAIGLTSQFELSSGHGAEFLLFDLA